jgi:hypothetical protein
MDTSSPMSPLNAHLHHLTPNARQQRYLDFAHAALTHYALDAPHPVYLQHNSGITYRVEIPRTGDCFLLKIHAPVGLGAPPPFADIEMRLQWPATVCQWATSHFKSPFLSSGPQLRLPETCANWSIYFAGLFWQTPQL